MVVDSSALISILLMEADGAFLEDAQARLTGQPLLCKGEELIKTDIACICPPAQ